MDYEKEYKNSIERAKEQIAACGDNEGRKKMIYKIFPELAESEDERIRKEILKYLEERKILELEVEPYQINDWISWLEKQYEQKRVIDYPDSLPKDNWELIREFVEKFGRIPKDEDELNVLVEYVLKRQKPTDKVEPKFKVGDWIINNDKRIAVPTQILEIVEYGYVTSRGYTSFDKAKTDYHLWTIQDANDGDVLEFGDHGRLVVGIVSYVNKTTSKVDVYCLLETNNFKIGNYYSLDTIKPHPATKEQRELLFSKMKEAGYEWDAEKKELKKIEQKPVKWSEEDEKTIEEMIKHGNLKPSEVIWLKSLKPQPHWKPSKEQMDALDKAKNNPANYYNIKLELQSLYDDLQKL